MDYNIGDIGFARGGVLPPRDLRGLPRGGVGLTPQKLREVNKGWRGGLWATLAVSFLCKVTFLTNNFIDLEKKF